MKDVYDSQFDFGSRWSRLGRAEIASMARSINSSASRVGKRRGVSYTPQLLRILVFGYLSPLENACTAGYIGGTSTKRLTTFRD